MVSFTLRTTAIVSLLVSSAFALPAVESPDAAKRDLLDLLNLGKSGPNTGSSEMSRIGGIKRSDPLSEVVSDLLDGGKSGPNTGNSELSHISGWKRADVDVGKVDMSRPQGWRRANVVGEVVKVVEDVLEGGKGVNTGSGDMSRIAGWKRDAQDSQ